MRETKSKTHWVQFVLNLFLIILGIGLMILVLTKSVGSPKSEGMPTGSWFLVGTLASIGFFFLLWSVCYYKTITITDNSIKIKYPLIGKELNYKNKDILYWYEHVNPGKFGETKIFNFKTSDGKIIMFSSTEFWNYKTLILAIISKSKMDFINRVHILKRIFILFTISSVIIALVIIVTLKIGVK